MHHDETIILAEQHRSALLADAAATRAGRRQRSVRGRGIRARLFRRT